MLLLLLQTDQAYRVHMPMLLATPCIWLLLLLLQLLGADPPDADSAASCSSDRSDACRLLPGPLRRRSCDRKQAHTRSTLSTVSMMLTPACCPPLSTCCRLLAARESSTRKDVRPASTACTGPDAPPETWLARCQLCFSICSNTLMHCTCERLLPLMSESVPSSAALRFRASALDAAPQRWQGAVHCPRGSW